MPATENVGKGGKMLEKAVERLKEIVEEEAIKRNDFGSAHAVAWVNLPDDETLSTMIREHRGELVEIIVEVGISFDNGGDVANGVEQDTILVNLAEIGC